MLKKKRGDSAERKKAVKHDKGQGGGKHAVTAVEEERDMGQVSWLCKLQWHLLLALCLQVAETRLM